MSHDPPNESSAAKYFGEVLRQRLNRRAALKALAASALTACAPRVAEQPRRASSTGSTLRFTEIARGLDDRLHVPEGYVAEVLLRWGDPIIAGAMPFDAARQTAAAQAGQFGYNNDFLAFIPSWEAQDRALLVVNHEYTNNRLMFPLPPGRALSQLQVDVTMFAHGMSVVELVRDRSRWVARPDSPLNRRVTPLTPMRLSGPAAGDRRLRTRDSEDGLRTLGTYANCGGGVTPWHTVLSAEENFQYYFVGDPVRTPEAENHRRMGLRGGATNLNPWGRYYARWNLDANPAEPLHMGWVVELDPHDPQSVPIKRTALGRFKHEGCGVALNPDGRVAVFMGDDQPFEYVYRFVSEGRYVASAPHAQRDLLDRGVLSAARFDDDGTLHWLPLRWRAGPLTPGNGFRSQADVLLDTRRAADLVGATRMDRPEAVEVNPVTGTVFVMLTKNPSRSFGKTDGANPRPENRYGHVLELIPPGGDYAGDVFTWEVFLLAGDPRIASHGAAYHPAVSEHGWLNAPDNCAFDRLGRMWITTDAEYASKLANGLWACDVRGDGRALTRNFARAPAGAELTGPCFTPDNTALFCSVQHPAEGSVYAAPSTRWPDFDPRVPPRPAVVTIRRRDGGVIGT